MKPEFQDEKPVNPFDFDEGANFKLKIRQVEGYRNYDKSEFDKPSPDPHSPAEIGPDGVDPYVDFMTGKLIVN